MKKRKVLITMNDDLYKRVEILAEKCHRSRPDQFRHLLLTHPDMTEKTPMEKEGQYVATPEVKTPCWKMPNQHGVFIW